MPEHQVREIQLGSKQLVFLFVASVGLAVVVFLLGVSVGRGVGERAGPVPAAADEAYPPVAAGEMPPETEITPEQQAVLGTLADPSAGPLASEQAPESASDPPLAEPDAADGPVVPEQEPEAPPAEPIARPIAEPRAAEAPPSPPPTPRGEWSVQTGAYRSRTTADREAAALVDQGFEAYVDTTSQTGLFRVRIGPFAQREQAEAALARLRQQGSEGLVTR